MTYPKYAELPFVEGTTERHCWGVFGADDELGCLNFITPEKTAAAFRSVRHGVVVNLDLPLTEPATVFWSKREPLQHHEVLKRNSRDDYLDNFYLQGSTQWDGLRHQRFRQFGYYGGRQESDLDGGGVLGIDRWARTGIMTRGVLVDLPRHRSRRGLPPVRPDERFAVSAEIIEEIAADEGVAIEPGDVLLLRTGWLPWYLGLDDARRDQLVAAFREDRTALRLPGLDASVETTAWLWDRRIAGVVADNPTLEALPYDRSVGWAHHRLLVLLGLPLGELWALEDLAVRCAELGTWSFALVSAPLNLPRGCASPANAYAVF
ncbi:Kynurenine formamidase [Pseudonocardia thermophila]|jgi:Predicted metal-dependent hydrolase|uniref:Kynurenine formamidase n=1 Tax=Pseudonocardia thermophila TaxID=1848 RepID=A0A1M6XP74_PSETH|nr:cyclase family protein [Pseudonocardia thermophila]SHL07771.1 Kynurenine formamidase [Pseudonocardia thermophila]